MRRIAATALAALSLFAHAAASAAEHAAARPRLVVLLVIDGLPMRQVQAFKPQFGPDGLRRFLDHGVSYSQAFYAHAHTVTAAGHATLATGAHPARHGIVGNEWLDRATGAPVYNTEDRAHRYLEGRTAPDAGTSPKNLRVETFGDALRTREPGAKVIGVSGKDRGAILPAGHKGVAYMYRSETGRFTSTTYYMQQHPAWVNAFNAKRNAERFWHAEWKPLRPEADYAGSSPDGQPWQGQAGFGNRLPATLGAGMEAPGERFFTDVLTSPFGDQLTLEFALAALRNEGLGQDDIPDVLTVSLSSHDYINHVFGPESRLSLDHLLQVDRLLQGFFRELDREVGAGRYALALSADHGFLDTPEYRRSKGLPGGRLPVGPALTALNNHLAAEFGLPKLARGLSAGTVLFDEAALAAKGVAMAAVTRSAAGFLQQLDGIATSYGEADLASSAAPRADQAHLQALRLSWYPPRTGQLALVPLEGWMYSSRPTGSSHGSSWAYDQQVPILLWGPAWFGQGEVKTRVQPADLAPTLARTLGLPPLAQAQGQPLPLPKEGAQEGPQKRRPRTPAATTAR
ncbi:MAG: alkaline phosphatase family protein [Inhella sp.]